MRTARQQTHESQAARHWSLIILGAYLGLALALALRRLWSGTGSVPVVLLYAGLLGASLTVSARRHRWLGNPIVGWLPLLALPLLYWSIPWTAWRSPEHFDPLIQQWDRQLFGTDPARTLASAAPTRVVSELLHAAYLSYYVIIYGPPLVMFFRGRLDAFDEAVLGLTIAMATCFLFFCLMPVAGPRYTWPQPPEIPPGVFRSMALAALERGSSPGTAFPSSHMAIALTLSLSTARWNRRLGAPLLIVTALLGVGAVYGGFHYVSDMLAGAMIGVLAAWASARLRAEPDSRDRFNSRQSSV